jgi:hypothetical protein
MLNSEFHYPIYRSVTFDLIQSQFIPLHILKFLFSKVSFNINLQLFLRLLSGLIH